MKSDKHSKRNFKHSGIEKNDLNSQFVRGVKKDRSSKRRLSIYDEFDDDIWEEKEQRRRNADSDDRLEEEEW